MKRITSDDWLTSTPIAHRGLHDETIPENSLGAFEAAITAGYAIEFDVHLTRDGVPIINHDVDTMRTTGRPYIIARSTYDELAPLKLHGTAHRMATLDEALTLINGRVPVLIELKPKVIPLRIGPTVVKALAAYPGEYAVMSFDPRIMLWFKHSAPHIRRGLLSGHMRYPEAQTLNPATRFIIRSMLSVVVVRPHFLAYDITALPSKWLVFWRQVYRLPIIVWPVQSKTELNRARRLKTNIIFEKLRP